MAYIDKYRVIFSDDKRILIKCPEDFYGEYTIPDGVIRISDKAFSCCEHLTQVVVPNTVSHIGDLAFLACVRLSCINIPQSVISIGKGAFAHCRFLSEINIPEGDIKLGDFIFDDSGICKPLYTASQFIYMPRFKEGVYEISEGIKKIVGGAFADCKMLTNVIIPNSVIEIGNFAFRNCTNIQTPIYNKHIFAYLPNSYEGEYTIPYGISTIAGGAFNNCTLLTNIVIPDTVIDIGKFAFKNCNNLTTPIFNKHVFAYLPSIYIGEYTIPNGVEMIAGGAFYGCNKLSNIIIPDSVTSIGDYAFAKCDCLINITTPNGVRYMSSNDFDTKENQ